MQGVCTSDLLIYWMKHKQGTTEKIPVLLDANKEVCLEVNSKLSGVTLKFP